MELRKTIQMDTFDYEELIKHPGTKKHGFMDIASQADGSMMRIPYCIVVGAKPGKTILIDGGIHGDEVEAADAAAHVYQELDPQKVTGVYVAVPHLNLEGFNIGHRMNITTDLTHADMNRIFPGDGKSGKMSAYLLDKFVNTFVTIADYWVTCHSGGDPLFLTPTACYTTPELDKDFGDLTLNMAKCFMTPVLWKNDPTGGVAKEGKGATSARQLAEMWHKAYICLEMGGNCAVMEQREQIYDLCHDGIMNLLTYLGFIEGEMPKFRDDQIETPIDYLHILHGGIYKPQKHFLEKAKKGEVLGIVTNIFGETIDELVAPYDGIVVGSHTPPVIQPRDWACLFGRI